MGARLGWMDAVLVISAILFLAISIYGSLQVSDVPEDLKEKSYKSPLVDTFLIIHPDAEAYPLRLSGKGVWAIQNDVVLPERFEDDPLVIALRRTEFKDEFPNVWVVAFSPNKPERRNYYVAPHPPAPAIFVFFEGGEIVNAEEVK